MSKKIYLDTARSYHMQCFICGRKNKKLHIAPTKSIAYAYITHKIVIKHHARCCGIHLNIKGEIKEESFNLIKTKPKEYDENVVRMMDSLKKISNLKQTCCIFDEFKDLITLDESHCYKITRWSKNQFISFT